MIIYNQKERGEKKMKKYRLNKVKFIGFILTVIFILFIAWVAISYAEIVIKNLNPHVDLATWNIFYLFMK